ncbi:MAG: hypothetical protein K2J71_06540 [Oscillospiraceae bacterium]|nr:hypothetical protein [Oscillospiraceae bacterium]
MFQQIITAAKNLNYTKNGFTARTMAEKRKMEPAREISAHRKTLNCLMKQI